MNVCVVIPVYNESKSIGRMVEALKKKNFDVLVVDDGSTDNSGDIASQMGARVIQHARNQGKGKSLQVAFQSILQENRYDAVITLDGDGQHDVEDIPQFLSAAKRHPNSIITGTRMANPRGMPWLRLTTNRLMSWMISSLCKQSIPDTQCGFRLISRGVLKEMSLISKDFQIETEVLVQASKKRFKIYSVPIQTIYGTEKSKINPLLDTIRFIMYFCKEIFSPKS